MRRHMPGCGCCGDDPCGPCADQYVNSLIVDIPIIGAAGITNAGRTFVIDDNFGTFYDLTGCRTQRLWNTDVFDVAYEEFTAVFSFTPSFLSPFPACSVTRVLQILLRAQLFMTLRIEPLSSPAVFLSVVVYWAFHMNVYNQSSTYPSSSGCACAAGPLTLEELRATPGRYPSFTESGFSDAVFAKEVTEGCDWLNSNLTEFRNLINPVSYLNPPGGVCPFSNPGSAIWQPAWSIGTVSLSTT